MKNLSESSTIQTVTTGTAGKKRLRRPICIVAGIVVLAVILLLLRPLLGGGNKIAPGTYLSAPVSLQDITVSVSGTGVIQPNSVHKIPARVMGDVLDAPFEEGQQVTKGDVLFRIDPSDFESTLRQSELAVQQAQVAYDQLLKTQSDNNKNCSITASEAGTIVTLYAEQGDMVAAGTVIADLLDRDYMKLTLPFHSTQATSFHPGQPALICVDGTLETLNGTVDCISAADSVGPGGTLVRNVTVLVSNPGALSDASRGTAVIDGTACAAGANFAYAVQKQLIAKASGELESLFVDEGDRVSEDQVIGTIDASSVDSQVENARLAVENAQLALERVQDQMEDYTVTSNINGILVEKNCEVGDTLDASSEIQYVAIVYDLSALTFDMAIDERDVSGLQPGQKVLITADALSGETFSGVVERVGINGSTISGKTTYPVTVRVDGAPSRLYPGMNVSAEVIVEELGSRLCIPVDYVSRGDTVLVALPGCLDETGNVVDPSKIEQRQVTLGSSSEEYIEILSGLSEGETVLVENRASNIMSMMMGV